MSSEGVSTRPIKLISGKSPFTETFFDSVKVPKKNLVGTLNDGWTIAKYLLTHERQMIGGVGETEKKKALSEVAIESIGITNGLLSNDSIRSKIANLEMNEKIFELTIQRALDEHKAGIIGAVSSFFKYYGTELAMQKEELRLRLMDLIQPNGLVKNQTTECMLDISVVLKGIQLKEVHMKFN